MSIVPFCTFVPPYILENLAHVGHETARLSLLQSSLSREQRQKVPCNLDTISGNISASGLGHRRVFDCQNNWTQQLVKVCDEGSVVTTDPAVSGVYEASGVVRNYLKQILKRDSIDNAGMDLIINVHFGENYLNAFWDGIQLTFGDGDGLTLGNFSRSLDVIAHELAHGLVQFTARLDYQGEAGALNEHFADVFTCAVTQHAKGQEAENADWLIGAEIFRSKFYGEALRSMKAPGTAYSNSLLGHDRQVSHFREVYIGPEDNQGVHINSGIMNRAFYLVATGGIGTDRAFLIWYAALQKLWHSANFNDAAKLIMEIAHFLTIREGWPHGTGRTVREAFWEVGLPHS